MRTSMLFAACAVAAVCTMAAASTDADSFNFLVMGDWGGQGSAPFTTPAEVGCAKGMGLIASQMNSQFVLGLGDNFYESGIHGSDKDPRFNETFESVFTAPSLQVPFYFIAGNHDHLGNVQSQIDYTKDSTRWKFPSSYYSFNATFAGNVTIKIILFDTVLAAGLERDYEFGVFDAIADEEAVNSQYSWIEDELKAAEAAKVDYIWVGGHYPVWSVCEHGPNEILKLKLKPMLEKYNANYMCGHDHCLEHLEDNGVVYSLTGASHECCYSNKHKDSVPKDSLKYSLDGSNRPSGVLGGFSSFQFTPSSLTIRYHSDNGTVLYTAAPIAPRTSLKN